MHADLIEHREKLGKQVVDVAFQLHSKLGPGLLKSVYETCFCYELNRRNIPFVSQKKVPIVCDSIVLKEGLKLDILVDNLIIIELKAQENYHPVREAQLLSYLRLSNKNLRYIINFTVPLIKDGMKRMVL